MPGTAFTENVILELIKGNAVSPPSKLVLALASKPQIRTVTGATVNTELNYTGYLRSVVNLAEEVITAGVEGAAAFMLNNAAIALQPNTGANELNNAETWLLIDSTTARGAAGNVWVYGTLEEIVAIVKAMETVKMPAKALKIEAN